MQSDDCADSDALAKTVILQKTSIATASNPHFSFADGVSERRQLQACQRLTLFLFIFMAVFWCLVPILGHHSPPLDVIEMHTWAAAPQLGYYKHPPLPAWIIYLSEAIFGVNRLALFLPSALSITLTLAAVWPLATRFFGSRRALIALFLQATVAYYHLFSPDYNHNVAQMPFWAGALCAAYFALRLGHARYWLAFGLLLGLTALAKYSALFLLAALFLLVLWEKEARAHLNLKNLALAGTATLAVLWAHLWWLWINDLAPLHYARERVAELAANASWAERFTSYLGMQVLVHGVPLLLALWLYWRAAAGSETQITEAAAGSQFNRRFLLVAGLGPFVLTLVVGLSGGFLHPMWASAMFPLSGLLLVYWAGAASERLWGRGWLLAWVLLMSVFGALYAAKNTTAWHSLSGKYTRATYPGPELAAELDARWQQAFPGKPLRYIIGTPWEAGVASFFSKYQPQIVIDADLRISPWASVEQIDRCGAITISSDVLDLVPELDDYWPDIEAQERFVLSPARRGSFPQLGMHWALIAPQGDCR